MVKDIEIGESDKNRTEKIILIKNEEDNTLIEGKNSKYKYLENNEDYSVLSDLKNPTTIINLISVTLCFCIVSFSYYMIGFYMKYVGGNIFINTIASGISETIGSFSAGYIQKVFGTKKAFII